MKRLVAFVFIFIMIMSLMSVPFTASAAEYGCNVDTTSTAVLLENLDTNTIVYEKNADERTYPASLTKMMTYIIVTENVPDLVNTKVKITQQALDGLDPQSSVMGLSGYVGQEFSVLDLLYGLMIPSGNDAALVLANYVGDGVVSNFVDLMNHKAGQLGCKNTHFVNPHGLYDPMHYSTARDLSIIAKYAITKPHYTKITSTWKYNVAGMTTPLENTNYMLNPADTKYYYQPVTSGKTGYTDEAGKCLVTTAGKENYNYLCIALGSPYSYSEDINYAMLESKELYEWAFNNISMLEVLPSTDVIRALPVAYVLGDKRVNVVPEKSVNALLPNDYDKSLITTSVNLPGHTTAPLKKGQLLGTIDVYYDGELVGKTNLVSSEDVELDKSSLAAHKVKNFLDNNIILILIGILVVIAIIVLIVCTRRRHKKNQSRYRYR